MIQDITPHVLKNEYRPASPDGSDKAIIYSSGKILIKADREKHLLSLPKISELNVNKEEWIYLFAVDEEHLFLHMGAVSEYPQGYEYLDFREIRRMKLEPQEYVFALFTAYHLSVWYETSRYCGRCGKPTVHDTEERAMRCEACGNIIYPRINPAVIVGVINGDRLLVTKYKAGYGGNALIAGFTEIGETLEQTVQREVREETGLQVRKIRYYKSQPWGPASDILAGFYCETDGDETIVVDERELKSACWVSREEIVLQETDYSLTNEMMKTFKEGKI